MLFCFLILFHFRGHDDEVLDVAFDYTGERIVTASSDGMLNVNRLDHYRSWEGLSIMAHASISRLKILVQGKRKNRNFFLKYLQKSLIPKMSTKKCKTLSTE